MCIRLNAKEEKRKKNKRLNEYKYTGRAEEKTNRNKQNTKQKTRNKKKLRRKSRERIKNRKMDAVNIVTKNYKMNRKRKRQNNK
jgi:hypothetical protein